MPNAKITDEQFIEEFPELGAAALARKYGMSVRNIHQRRRSVERRHGVSLTAPEVDLQAKGRKPEAPEVISLDIKDGVVLVGSDCHYWPGMVSTAHMAMLHFIREMKPKAVILNGDVMDGGRISRYPPIGWETRPTIIDEIKTCQERLAEIEWAAPKGVRKIWSMGNHDSRFETRIATLAPEFAGVHGVHLKDHFPRWEPCWAVFINTVGRGPQVVVKHRYKGGMHAPQNNTLWAGATMVTGHLHSLKVQPISDYAGTRWGVDSGTMAEPYGPQFISYTEANPVNWRSGLVVLTFKDGQLLWPELAHVTDLGVVDFRGEHVRVADKAKAGF